MEAIYGRDFVSLVYLVSTIIAAGAQLNIKGRGVAEKYS